MAAGSSDLHRGVSYDPVPLTSVTRPPGSRMYHVKVSSKDAEVEVRANAVRCTPRTTNGQQQGKYDKCQFDFYTQDVMVA
ncbi:MAG: hypothetical protein WBM24_02535 [Candidatus Sulfotelmatobacter sp.]